MLEQKINDRSIHAELVEPGEPTPTAPDAARVLAVDIDQIIKSLVFTNKRDQAVLAVISGPDRVDRRKLQQATGLKALKLATPDQVLQRTGYPVGSMPPVAHTPPISVWLDQRVQRLDRVFGGGGVANQMIAISPEEILRVTNGQVADITEDRTSS